MSEFPRHDIPPLDPPPGQFDVVLRRAHERRQRHVARALAVTAVLVAGMAGGLTLDQPMATVPDALRAAGNQIGLGGQSDVERSAEAADAASRTPGQPAAAAGPAPTAETPAAAPSDPPRDPVLVVAGKAVGAAGQPASGLFVYPGVPGADGFVPAAEPAGRTAEDGTFSLPCTRTPVLLTPWRLNAPAGSSAAGATWAATFVGGATDVDHALAAPCTRGGRTSTTVVRAGSTLTGTVTIGPGCDTPTTALTVRLLDDPGLGIRVERLGDGDTYRVGGLPAGRHSVAAAGAPGAVVAVDGQTVVHDVAVSCAAVPTATPTPTATPSSGPVTSAPEQSPTPSPSASRGP